MPLFVMPQSVVKTQYAYDKENWTLNKQIIVFNMCKLADSIR